MRPGHNGTCPRQGTAVRTAVLLCAWSVIRVAAALESTAGPATFHLSFDSWAVLDEDYSARFAQPEPDRRGLALVPGRFGLALVNRNEFVEADLQQTHMSTRDLDVLLEVLCHYRFAYWKQGLKVGGLQPYFWGTGRLKTDGGTLAVWAQGPRSHPGYLFFQGSSSFGRLEKDLVVIQLHEDRSLEACLVDGCYRRHVVRSGPVWDDRQLQHVALSWDRSQGLILYVNGQVVASSWGEDAWWTSQIPGLFHLPMAGLLVDELWLFDRPLEAAEIVHLMRENRPPTSASPPATVDPQAARRLQHALLGPTAAMLPVVPPSDGQTCVNVREILPLSAGDGCVQAPTVLDGKYEMAWPMGYCSFTNILGDSDFQAEKLDVHLPSGTEVNYVTLEGNLSEVRLLAGWDRGADPSGPLQEVLTVPDGGQFFHGQSIEPVTGRLWRIPLHRRYGSPAGYAEGLQMTLSGATRFHELAFFHVEPSAMPSAADQLQTLPIGRRVPIPDDNRFGYAMRAQNDRRSAAVYLAGHAPDAADRWIGLEPFARLNLLTEAWAEAQAIRAVTLSLRLRGVTDGDLVLLRLHDAGLPTRIWTSVVFALRGFCAERDTLNVRLDMTDIRLAPGDRLWLDVAQSGTAELLVGGSAASKLFVETAPLCEADPRYGWKALQPALSSFAKIYPWYYPWVATGQQPHPDHPTTFGGYYDIVSCPLIVTRTDPDHVLANTLADLALIRRPVKPGYTPESWETCPRFWPPLAVAKADESPAWAFFMHQYLQGYKRIVHWWCERQNPDGQVGGGWNDDVLFASRLPGPFLYTGDRPARRLFDRIFAGLDQTKQFDDGYCRVAPIDPMHALDLVRHRYEGLLFDPGDPTKLRVAMQTAWHLGKPAATPVNYADGAPFQYDHDLLRWYWGATPDYPVYTVSRSEVTDVADRFAPAMNAVLAFRYTESGMFTDAFAPPGSSEIKQLLVGGTCGPFLSHLTLAATWEEGGEPLIPKWVEYASDTRFVAHLYSYDTVERNVTVRFCRLKKGRYRITLTALNTPTTAAQPSLSRRLVLRRFACLTVPIPPGREWVLQVELEQALPSPEPLPDLAVDSLVEVDGRLQAEVLNFGAGGTGPCLVHLQDAAGRKLAERQLPALKSAVDCVPAAAPVEFPIDCRGPAAYRVIVDPNDTMEEILEENNEAELLIDHDETN